MKDITSKIREKLEKRQRNIETMGRGLWKPYLADCVLDLLNKDGVVTIDNLLKYIEEKPTEDEVIKFALDEIITRLRNSFGHKLD